MKKKLKLQDYEGDKINNYAMEDKMERCEDCILYDECLRKGCGDFKPKEKPMNKDLEYDENKVQEGIDNEFMKYFDTKKPMNKVIFESEEEFSRYDNQVNDSTYKGRLKKAKERGFIRKSPVEEAEEI